MDDTQTLIPKDKKKFTNKFNDFKNNKTVQTIWEYKFVGLLLVGGMAFIIGLLGKAYLPMFIGLILLGFGIALFSAVSKYLFKIPGLKNKIGTESLESIKISTYGIKNQGKEELNKIRAEDFLNAIIYGEMKRDKKGENVKNQNDENEFFFHGIQYQFRHNTDDDKDKENFKESQAQLDAINNAYAKDKSNGNHEQLKKFFLSQIYDFVAKKIANENRLIIERTFTEGQKTALNTLFTTNGTTLDKFLVDYQKYKLNLLDDNEKQRIEQIFDIINKNNNTKNFFDKLNIALTKSDDKNSEADLTRARDDIAERMAKAFKKYLGKSPDGKLKAEDFALDEEGKNLDGGKDYLFDFLKEEMIKESTRGVGGYIKFGFVGAGIGGVAGVATHLASMFKPDFLKNLNSMYESIGIKNMSGLMSIVFGAIFTSLIFLVSTYVYNNREPEVPERLSNHTQREAKQEENTITAGQNP